MSEVNKESKRVFSCSDCTRYSCKAKKEEAYPPFCLTKEIDKELLEETVNIYKTDEEVGKIAVTSASIEGEFYCRMTRVEETIEFIKRMGYKKIGVASCVGLMRETSNFCKLLKAEGLDYYAVGCKVGAVDKTEVGVPNEKKINGGCGHESMCNPIMQAKVLAANGCDFNVLVGLCVGHDTLFLKFTETPTTVLVAKDRVLQHNTVAALYGVGSSYSRFKKLGL